jgi:hypothetical protein
LRLLTAWRRGVTPEATFLGIEFDDQKRALTERIAGDAELNESLMQWVGAKRDDAQTREAVAPFVVELLRGREDVPEAWVRELSSRNEIVRGALVDARLLAADDEASAQGTLRYRSAGAGSPVVPPNAVSPASQPTEELLRRGRGAGEPAGSPGATANETPPSQIPKGLSDL